VKLSDLPYGAFVGQLSSLGVGVVDHSPDGLDGRSATFG
jgi:hypothetical protein